MTNGGLNSRQEIRDFSPTQIPKNQIIVLDIWGKRRVKHARHAIWAGQGAFPTKSACANAVVTRRDFSFGPYGPKQIKKLRPLTTSKCRPSLLFIYFLIARRAVWHGIVCEHCGEHSGADRPHCTRRPEKHSCRCTPQRPYTAYRPFACALRKTSAPRLSRPLETTNMSHSVPWRPIGIWHQLPVSTCASCAFQLCVEKQNSNTLVDRNIGPNIRPSAVASPWLRNRARTSDLKRPSGLHVEVELKTTKRVTRFLHQRSCIQHFNTGNLNVPSNSFLTQTVSNHKPLRTETTGASVFGAMSMAATT